MSIKNAPQLLRTIVGHEAAIAALLQLARSRAVPHALLFTGPAGVGKKTIARAFAGILLENAENPGEADRLVQKGAHPDFHTVAREAGKKDIPVDAIRTLCSALQLKPYYGHSTVAVIDNAHEMNVAASNSLLTTLEEPNSGNYIILITDSPQRLPETIVSRCQQFYFAELSEARVHEIILKSFAEFLDPTMLENVANSFRGTTLGPLLLDTLIDTRTLQPFDTKRLASHFNQLLEERERVRSRLAQLFDKDTKLSPGDAVALGSELASEKESGPVVWELLSAGVRDRMRTAPPQQSTAWGDVLLELLEFQKLTHERSLNPQLQFSSICLKIANCA